MTVSPCPICLLPDGFHDHDDRWTESKHRAHIIPPGKVVKSYVTKDAAEDTPATGNGIPQPEPPNLAA